MALNKLLREKPREYPEKVSGKFVHFPHPSRQQTPWFSGSLNERGIVLIHGWGAKSEKLGPLGNKLRKFGWEVFLPKLPGFEENPPKTIWGVDEYANHVLRLTKGKFAGKRFFIFGHSFGGRIAIKIASKQPDLLSGIILCSTAGLSRPNIFKRLVFLILAKIGISLNLGQGYRWLLYKLAREHDYERTQGVMREIFKKVVAQDLRFPLPQIHVPTLILWGKNDRTTPIADALLAKQRIKNSTLKIFADQGHRLPYNKPKEVAREITRWATYKT